MKLQTILIAACLAIMAAIIFLHHRTRTVVPVNDVIVYAGGSSDIEDGESDAAHPRASVFGGSGLSRSEMEYGVRRYHELLAEARTNGDERPAPAATTSRPRWMPSGHARPQAESSGPSAWKIGMNKKGSAQVRPYRGSSRAGIYGRAERSAIEHRPSVFERSRQYRERGSVYPLGAHEHSARQRRTYNNR
jgi:hypothetical protein